MAIKHAYDNPAQLATDNLVRIYQVWGEALQYNDYEGKRRHYRPSKYFQGIEK